MCAWFFASLFFCYQLHVFIRRDSTIYLHYCSSIFWRTGRKWDPLTHINQPFSPSSSQSQCSRYVCALCVVAEQPSSLKIYLSAYLSVRAAIKRALRSSVSGFKQSKCGERESDVMWWTLSASLKSPLTRFNIIFFCLLPPQLISRIIEQFCETFLSFLCCFAFFLLASTEND